MAETATEHARGPAEVVVLAGFLGAGKTTLLKRILSWETDLSGTAVIVNEFGEVGIDGALLGEAGTDMVELASGCVCCTLKPDLIQTFRDVEARFAPKRIFLETTGVADPYAVAEVFSLPALRDRFRLHKTVTVLDADYWEAREAFGPLFHNQLRAADLILLNKVDTVAEADVPRFLSEIHGAIPEIQIVPTIHCRVDPETFFGAPSRPENEPGKPVLRHFVPMAPSDACSHDPPPGQACPECRPAAVEAASAGYVSFSFSDPRPLDEARFHRFVGDLPWEVFRMKGTVRFPDRTVMVNYVGGRNQIADWDGKQECRLAFVGWKVEGDTILDRLKGCVAE